MFENRPYLKSFIDKYKPSKNPRISPDIIDEYAPVLPDAFIIAWQNVGFGYCAYNTIELVNPSDYTSILLDFDLNALDFYIVAVTAVGDLIIWNAHKYALYRYSIHTMTCEKVAGSTDIDRWFGALTGQRYHVIDFLKLRDIEDRLTAGMLRNGQILTFTPPLLLEGDRRSTSICDTIEYFSSFCSEYQMDHSLRFKEVSRDDNAAADNNNANASADTRDSAFESIGQQFIPVTPLTPSGYSRPAAPVNNVPAANTFNPPPAATPSFIPPQPVQVIMPNVPNDVSSLANAIVQRMRDHRFVPAVRLDSVNRKHAILDHKIGGPYYVPNLNKIPKNLQTGGELFLLVQINFTQIQRIPDFPTEGLLQIFMDHDPHAFRQFAHPTQQISWRIRYIPQTPSYAELSNLTQHMPQVNSGITALPFDTMRTLPLVPQDMMQDTPLEDFPYEAMVARYCADLMPQSPADPRASLFNEAKRVAQEAIRREFRPGRMNDTLIQIGGNPTFYRPDPRPVDPRFPGIRTPNVLLLQLPCFEGFNWGDPKDIVHFFISRKDLRERNFNNVMMDMTF